MRSLNTTDLINTIKRRASIPKNQNTFTDDDILEIATEEMFISVLPNILELHQDYYLYSVDVPLVSDVSTYTIPYRAIGTKLRDLSYVDTDENVYEMTRIPIDDITKYNQGFTSSQMYRTFYMQNNQVVLYPGISSSPVGSLRFSFYLSPNSLVKTSRSTQITAIDTTTGIVTVNSIPANFSVNIQYDFMMANSPHKILTYDKSISAINTGSKTLVFTPADLPKDLSVGDYLLQAGESIYPQIPTELHSVLAQYAAIACLESLNDSEGLKNALVKLQKMEKSIPRLIDNRVEASAQKVTSYGGLLRNAAFKKYRGV